MSVLNLTFEELCEVVQTCELLRLPPSPPPYLKHVIERRLHTTAPDLAPRVREFSQRQMKQLSGYIRFTHRLVVRRLPGIDRAVWASGTSPPRDT